MERRATPTVFPNLGTCDWGGCDEIAVALRYWADRKVNVSVCSMHMTPTIRCTTQELPEELNVAIRASGITRKQICKEIGVTESVLSAMLLSKRRITLRHLNHIQRIIDLRIILIPTRDPAEGRRHG